MQKLVVLLLPLLCTAVGASTAGFEAAAQLLHSGLDPSAEPCHNFYQYACGKWPATHNATDDFDSLTITTIKVLDTTGAAMVKYDPITATPFPYNQAGILMHNCLHGRPTRGDDLALALLIVDKLGGWPSVNGKMSAIPGGAVGVDALVYGQLGVSPMMGADVEANYWHPGRQLNLLLWGQGQRLIVHGGKPGLPHKDIIIAEYIATVGRLQSQVLTESELATVDAESIRRDATVVAELEMAAVNATWEAMNWQLPDVTFKQYLMHDPQYFANPLSVRTAIQRWPHINWPQYLINVAVADGLSMNTIFGTDFHAAYPSYMDWLDGVVGSTDDRDLRNWIMYRLSQHMAGPTGALATLSKGRQTKDRPTPAGYCANRIMRTIPFLVGRIYAEESQLNQKDMNELNEMIGLMLSSWRGMIAEVPWMSAESKGHAFDKIDHNVRNVGWPAWIMNDAALHAHYLTLNLTATDDLFASTVKSARWAVSKQLKMIGSPVDREAQSWMMSPAIVNAWYAPSLNSITFPAAIMSSPFYNSSYPKAYNYAHMGAVMGHELGHGFDNNGINWGPYGEYVNGSWFDAQSKKGFEHMTECVVEEYNGMCLQLNGSKHCVNGTLTLPENIADNGGLVASSRAFHAVIALQGGEAKMPPGYGVISTMTEEQLFWFSFGNTWCSNEPDAAVINQMHHDPHSPDPIRVLGTLRNVPAFAKAFNCPAGSYMAPTTHCHVWTN